MRTKHQVTSRPKYNVLIYICRVRLVVNNIMTLMGSAHTHHRAADQSAVVLASTLDEG